MPEPRLGSIGREIGDGRRQAATARDDRVAIAFNCSLKGLGRRPLRMLRRECLDAIEREGELHVDRLFSPERAVVVERGDALGRRHELRAAVPGHAGDEVDNRGLRGAVVPRRQRIPRGRARRGGLPARPRPGATARGDNEDEEQDPHPAHDRHLPQPGMFQAPARARYALSAPGRARVGHCRFRISAAAMSGVAFGEPG